MPPWSWFLIIVGVGACLLAAAVLLDRRSRRRAIGADEPAPLRNHEGVDRHVPTYLTQDDIDAMEPPGKGDGTAIPHRGEGFGFGHAHPDFATTTSGATWDDPRLLIVDGTVDSMRELLTPLSWATEQSPLVIVASEFDPEVLTTLAANRRALNMPVLAARASERDRLRLAELTGAAELQPSDLQAGYVPDDALGRASHWSSTSTKTWVEPQNGNPQPPG